jgi:hypothetical protein
VSASTSTSTGGMTGIGSWSPGRLALPGHLYQTALNLNRKRVRRMLVAGGTAIARPAPTATRPYFLEPATGCSRGLLTSSAGSGSGGSMG